jgi:hypothetical protein
MREKVVTVKIYMLVSQSVPLHILQRDAEDRQLH